MDPSSRAKEQTPLEQAVSRAMRDNLSLVQHTTKELSQALEDFVAACGSSRNANMLPAMVRAQTAAASLTSMLEVLSRVLTASLHPARIGSSEAYVAAMVPAEAPAAELPEPPRAAPKPEPVAAAPVVAAPPPPPPPPPPVVAEPEPAPVAAAPVVEPPPPPPAAPEPAPVVEVAPPAPPPVAEARPGGTVMMELPGTPLVPAEPAPDASSSYQYQAVETDHAAVEREAAAPPSAEVPAVPPPAPEPEPAVAAAPAAPAAAVWRVEDLPADQQELHRRANRHAKVSMQDIYLLRPKDVQAARQNKDICVRLKADIEKARKEYVRRFNPILEHPVDYFYHWMVEVLAEGKPEVLGQYPYPSAAPRR